MDHFIDELTNPKFNINEEQNEYTMIELVKKTSIEIDVPEPIKISLLSLLEVINKINNVLEKIYVKIEKHQKIYFKNMFKINIQDEIMCTVNLTNLFNSRLELLFNLLKIYKDIVIKN